MRLFALCLPLLILAGPAHADYTAPPMPEMVRTATAVVDATLAGVDADGAVRLTVHATWAGTAPATITGIAYSCFGGTHGLRPHVGKRMLLLLKGDQLFEEQTFWPVRQGKLGLEVNIEDLAEPRGLEKAWRPLAAVRATVAKLRSGAP